MMRSPALRAARQRAAHELRHAAGGDADDDVPLLRPQARDCPRAFLVVVLDAFLGLEDGVLAAGHDRADARRGDAEGRRHLGRLDHAQAPARAGADEDHPPALAERLGDHLDAGGDPLLLAVHGGDDLAILVDHQVDDVADRGRVQRQAVGIDRFGGEGFPLGHGWHEEGARPQVPEKPLKRSAGVQACQRNVPAAAVVGGGTDRLLQSLPRCPCVQLSIDDAAAPRPAAGSGTRTDDRRPTARAAGDPDDVLRRRALPAARRARTGQDADHQDAGAHRRSLVQPHPVHPRPDALRHRRRRGDRGGPVHGPARSAVHARARSLPTSCSPTRSTGRRRARRRRCSRRCRNAR